MKRYKSHNAFNPYTQRLLPPNYKQTIDGVLSWPPCVQTAARHLRKTHWTQ